MLIPGQSEHKQDSSLVAGAAACLSVPGEQHSQNSSALLQPSLTGTCSAALSTDIFGGKIKSSANKGLLATTGFVYGW